MALTIYGSPRSRTMRTLWAAAELGLDYVHVPLAWDDPALKQPEFLALNPAGAIPVIVDGDIVLAESLAINLYLARTYGGSGEAALYPPGRDAEAQILKWSLWAQADLEPWVQKDARFETLRVEAREEIRIAVQQSLRVLDKVLANRDWLACAHFTVADLNVASVLSPSRAALLDLGSHDHVRAWLERCYARPACQAARARHASI